jgi:WD40 repeat protein/DNA-binding SARP family transcriptional activator/energy-coupling factor transporter ATP-binding protein EcfA2
MRFGVLGDLRVTRDDRPVVVPGKKERLLLFHLVARANRVVSADELSEGLWGDAPPRQSERYLKTHVARLRDALAPGRKGVVGSPISTVASGYRLDVDPDDVDALRFERLVREGHTAAVGGFAARAEGLLSSALELWEGTPYGGVDAPVLLEASRRLEELRRVATQDRVQAGLALGRHRELLPAIEAAVRGEPLHEPYWVQLMTALFRSGRPAEAVSVYGQLRAMLASELGVEPGLEARTVHERILRQDATLEAPFAPGRRLPVELQDATPLFGRQREQAALRRWWRRARAGEGLVGLVVGPPGSGRTRLAGSLARTVWQDGSPVVYAQAGPPTSTPLAALARIEDSVGVDAPDGLPDAAALGGRIAAVAALDGLLVVVDDLVAGDDHLIDALLALQAALAGSPVLIVIVGEVEDERLAAVVGERVVTLGRVGHGAAVRIISRYTGDADAAATEIIPRSGALPGPLHREAAMWALERSEASLGTAISTTVSLRDRLRRSRSDLSAGIAARSDLQESLRERGGPAAASCPYRGLAPYGVEHASLFFGREELVAELVGRSSESGLVIVTGPSGSGKSSIVRAGLMASLARGSLPGSESWELVEAVLPELDLSGFHPREQPERGRRVVLIDQLERIFTEGWDRARQEATLTALADAADAPGVNVVAVIRGDFFGELAVSPAFARLAAQDAMLVPPMQVAELIRAVELPALRGGLTMEQGLAAMIGADVAEQPGALPLLSVALVELWERREDGRLTIEAYSATGGVRGAVGRLAETAYADLGSEGQALARRMLLRSVSQGPRDSFVSRQVPFDEVAAEGEAAWQVLRTLAERRLVTVGDQGWEVSHEAVYSEWPRLRDWLHEDRQGLETQRRLTDAARHWSAAGRDESELYRGTRLATAVGWAETGGLDRISESERAFIEASASAADREAAEIRDRAARTERSNRRLRTLVAGLALGLLTIGGLAAIALRQTQLAGEATLTARAAELGAEALVQEAPDRSLLMAVEARHIADSPETRSALLTALNRIPEVSHVMRDPDRLLDSDVSPDGSLLVTGSNRGFLSLWETATGRLVDRLGEAGPAAGSVAFGPDGRVVAVNGFRGDVPVVRLWDLATREAQEVPMEVPVGALAFDPRGHTLMALDAAGRLSSIDLPSRRVVPERQLTGEWWSVGYSADGSALVISTTEETRVVRGSTEVKIAVGGPASISPDGSLVAVAAWEPANEVLIFDAFSGAQVTRFSGHTAPVQDVRFMPGGGLLTAGDDGLVILWDPRSGSIEEVLRGHSGRVHGLSADPGGAGGYSVSLDGTALAWDLAGRSRLGMLAARVEPGVVGAAANSGPRLVTLGEHGVVSVLDRPTMSLRSSAALGQRFNGAAAIDPRGAWFVAGTDDGLLVLGTLDPPAVTSTVSLEVAPFAGALDVSPDGALVAAAGPSGLRLLSPAGEEIARLATGEDLSSVAFSAGGALVAAGGSSGRVLLWSLPDAQPRGELVSGSDRPILSLRFVGQMVVAGGADGRVRTWDLASRLRTSEFLAHRGFVLSVFAAADGRLLLTSGSDGSLALWDLSTGAQVGANLVASPNQRTFAFDAGAAGVETVSEDGRVRLWPTEPSAWEDRACRIAGRNLSREEWVGMFGDDAYRATCPEWAAGS